MKELNGYRSIRLNIFHPESIERVKILALFSAYIFNLYSLLLCVIQGRRARSVTRGGTRGVKVYKRITEQTATTSVTRIAGTHVAVGMANRPRHGMARAESRIRQNRAAESRYSNKHRTIEQRPCALRGHVVAMEIGCARQSPDHRQVSRRDRSIRARHALHQQLCFKPVGYHPMPDGRRTIASLRTGAACRPLRQFAFQSTTALACRSSPHSSLPRYRRRAHCHRCLRRRHRCAC
jgi:hypothetical protein